MFVVWKDTNGIRKGRPIVDIRPLNAVTKRDNYPTPTLDDMLNEMAGAKRISCFDIVAAFHQHLVHPDDRKVLVLNTHRG